MKHPRIITPLTPEEPTYVKTGERASDHTLVLSAEGIAYRPVGNSDEGELCVKWSDVGTMFRLFRDSKDGPSPG